MRKNIYIAYTGGTIGMRQSSRGWQPAPGFLAEQMAGMPELSADGMPTYEIHEFASLLDSSNMTPEGWIRIALPDGQQGWVESEWLDVVE